MGDDLKLLQRLADCGGMEMEFLELKRDAERYRWLRTQHENHEGIPRTFCVFAPDTASLEPVGSMPGELDAAIDAAMAAR